MDIYSLPDNVIRQQIGEKLKNSRLRQNMTQANLAVDAQVSLSTVKKIEKGQISSFDSFMRVIRVLGRLDALQQFVEPDEMSPNEYYEFVNSTKRRTRMRATSPKRDKDENEDSEW